MNRNIEPRARHPDRLEQTVPQREAAITRVEKIAERTERQRGRAIIDADADDMRGGYRWTG